MLNNFIEIEYKIESEYITSSGFIVDTSWDKFRYLPREAVVINSGDEDVKVGDNLYVVRLSMESAKLEGRLVDGYMSCRAFVKRDDIILCGRGDEWISLGDYLVVQPILNEDRSMFRKVGGVELLLGKEPEKYAPNEVVVKYANGEYEVGDRLSVVNLSKLPMEGDFKNKFGEDLFRVFKSQVCLKNGKLMNERVLVKPKESWCEEKGEMRGVVVKSGLRDLKEFDEIVYSKMCQTEVDYQGERLIVTEDNFIFFKIDECTQ